MSLEDLRDNYKNSRSQKRNVQLNGATFRQKLDSLGKGALIKKINRNHSNPHKYDEIESLNEKYGLIQSNYEYSLNKSKRWELVKDLKNNMNEFEENDLDVRVYETELAAKSRDQPKLVDLARSKGQKIEIKKTYANLNSIKQQEKLDILERLHPKEAPSKKVNRFKVKNFKREEPKRPERIVIKFNNNNYEKNQNEVEDDNIEYEVQYEPKHRVVKHGANLDRDPIYNKSVLKKNISYSDEDYDDIDYEEEEEEEVIEYEEKDSTIEISLNDLIERFSKSFIQKHEQNMKKLSFNEEAEFKEKKIYVERQMSFRENQTNILVPEFCEPIRVSLEIFNESIRQEVLKQTYGLNYNEGVEYSPRRFNLNLSEQIRARLAHKAFATKLDLIVWLRFQQVIQLEDRSFYDVSVCANLADRRSISLDNINPCQPYEIDTIVRKTIDLISMLPDESFKLNTPARKAKFNAQEKLPTLCGRLPQVKSLDELKLEMINSQKFQRTNSLEVVKETNGETTENSAETKSECVLCFEEKNVADECTLLTRCGHSVCNECMKYYVDSRLANALGNAGKFPCPSCSSELEISLLINFASNVALLDVYLKLTVEKVWFVLNDYQWCKANCSNILKIDMESSPYGTVSCTCGYKMCLKCNNPPHFPLSCKNSTNYYKQLKKQNPAEEQDDDNFYSSKGKFCPKCSIFMEKMYGCNQMLCSQCNSYFCWNCLKTWEEHLKLNDGAHACKEKETTNFINVDFLGKSNRNLRKMKKREFEDSLYHRNMRLSSNKYSEVIQNLIKTIDFEQLFDSENDANLSKTENIGEKSKYIIKKRNETKLFLNETVDFINELHFICEHGFVSLRDRELDNETKSYFSMVLRKIEVLIWRIKYNLEYGNGLHSLNEIKSLYARGIKLINILNNLKA